MITLVKSKPLHLFLFPLLFVANHFFSITTTQAIYSPIQAYGLWAVNVVVSALVCLALPWLFYKIISLRMDKAKSAIFSSVIFIPFFFFQELLILCNSFLENEIRIRWLILFTLFVTLVVGILVLRSKEHSLSVLNEGMNVLSGLLLAYVLITLIAFFDKKAPKRLVYDPPVRPVTCKDCPDIYFFLLDSYSSNKSLRDYFDFNNKLFVDTLETLGFRVADQAFSSYNKTIYSLGATLNMDPIRNLDQYYEKDVLNIIKENTVMRSLENAKYEIYNYSLFDIRDIPKYYSISYEYKMFTNEIFHHTIFRFLLDNTGGYLNLFDVHVDILEQVKKHAQSSQTNPRFFYNHILAPHAPFVMNSHGEEIEFLEQRNSQKDAYIEQVKGLNKMISETVKVIRKNSRESIILIQGDHGSRMVSGKDHEKESKTVFFAYLIPRLEKSEDKVETHQIFNLVFDNL